MGITRIAGWQATDARSIPEYTMKSTGSILVGTSLENAQWATVTGPTQFYRMARRVCYECPVTDASTLPDSPVNPGGLDTSVHTATIGATTFSYVPWHMADAQITRPYGRPLRGVYRETWEYALPVWQPVS